MLDAMLKYKDRISTLALHHIDQAHVNRFILYRALDLLAGSGVQFALSYSYLGSLNLNHYFTWGWHSVIKFSYIQQSGKVSYPSIAHPTNYCVYIYNACAILYIWHDFTIRL